MRNDVRQHRTADPVALTIRQDAPDPMPDRTPNHSSAHVLLVDDEHRTLKSLQFNLRNSFSISTATDPCEALDQIRDGARFAVVVSDFRMPGMDGITFLSQVRDISPDIVRILLTGQANTEMAARAVNQGRIFRFLQKPCTLQDLSAALEAGIRLHYRTTAEREILQGTLRGTVRVLSEGLGLAIPEAFERTERILKIVVRMAKLLQVPSPLELELATMLSHLGCLGLPREIIRKVNSGKSLAADEAALFHDHPRIGSMLIERIPRLETVARIIAMQHAPASAAMPLEARVLNMNMAYDRLRRTGLIACEVLKTMREGAQSHPEELVDALKKAVYSGEEYSRESLFIRQLKPSMVLDGHIETPDGLLLLAKGAELSEPTILRLMEISKNQSIVEPVRVLALRQ